jgi:hypothetical protein
VSGKQTIGLTLVAFLVLCALGFSVASCVDRAEAIEREPLAPKPCCDLPLRLADTVVVPFEILSDDARVREEQRCLSEGGEPWITLGCVHCDHGGPSRAGWTYGVSDVPKERRGVK